MTVHILARDVKPTTQYACSGKLKGLLTVVPKLIVSSERKKSHDKVYPKGYVEMLEQQQGQLVSGLQEMYHRLLAGQSWPGPTLSETNGHPLTHDILAALNLLEMKHDGSGEIETFEEDPQKLQSRLLADGAGFMQRRGSFSSDSEHSQHGQTRSSSHSTPPMAKPPIFNKDFTFSASPSPVTQSPVTRQRQSYPPAQQSPLHRNAPITNDPQFYRPEWSMPTFSEPEAIMRSKYAMQTPQLQELDEVVELMGNDRWDDPQSQYDLNMGLMSYPQQLSNAFGIQDLDPMEIEFQNFIQVAT